jgi:hypothetical protein
MYQFKGFAGITPLVSNDSGVTSIIGELSAYSASFARDVKIHTTAKPNVQIYEFFSSANSSGNDATSVTPPAAILTAIKRVVEWIYTRQEAVTTQENKADFLLAVQGEFQATALNFDCGAIVLSGQNKPYPTFISWKTTGLAEDNYTTIYFSDEIFRKLYDQYQIVVVPPLKDIDGFFQTYTDVVTTLGTVTYPETLNAIQAAKDGYPETLLTAETFNYVNPLNPSVMTKTNWSFLIYGPQGNNPDAIKQALIDYITSLSKKPLADWKKIFPDIFKSTEFLFVPKWHNYAINEASLVSGIYSPATSPLAELAYAKQVHQELTAGFIDTNLQIVAHPYKSIQLLSIGGADNRENKYKITDFFPDMISVSSTSADFNRMEPLTKGFLEKLAEMIYFAETLTAYSDLPTSYRRAVRSNVTYISVTYANIRFLVATKATAPTN